MVVFFRLSSNCPLIHTFSLETCSSSLLKQQNKNRTSEIAKRQILFQSSIHAQIIGYTNTHRLHLSVKRCWSQIVPREGSLIRLRQHPLRIAPESDTVFQMSPSSAFLRMKCESLFRLCHAHRVLFFLPF